MRIDRQMLKTLKQDLKAQRRIFRTVQMQRKWDPEEPTHVVFLVQETSVWPKSEPVARLMLESAAFHVTFLCLPRAKLSAMRENRLEFAQNDAVDYICARFGADNAAIVSAQTSDGWVDLAALRPHYVFYARPYDIYLPLEYRTQNVSRYARCCYIPYSFLMTQAFAPMGASPEFTRNIRLFFACERDEAEYVKKTLLPTPLRKVRLDGYPPLDAWWKLKRGSGPFTVTWTPRWTTDVSAGGGSSFFMYWDFFYELAAAHPELRVIVRPHPLAFENFINSGEMTCAQADELHEKWEALANGRIDEDGDYTQTLAQTDILVTDLSGIIYEYFMTGRPVVYCGRREPMETRDFALLFDSFYVVDSEKALSQRLSALLKGEDEKKDERAAAIETLRTIMVKPPEQIVRTILIDRFGKGAAQKRMRIERT